MPVYKYEFAAPGYIEETIIKAKSGEVIGTIRIKPSSVLWKPKGQQKYYSISLDDFADWITDPTTNARRTGS